MSLPFSERDVRRRKRKSEATKIKLPTQMQSKNMRKCPICDAPYVNVCMNCDYKNDTGFFFNDELFKKANEK